MDFHLDIRILLNLIMFISILKGYISDILIPELYSLKSAFFYSMIHIFLASIYY
jgi:hypothetical protein